MRPAARVFALLLASGLLAADTANVIATYNARPLWEADIRRVLDGATAEQRRSASSDPEAFLQDYFLNETLARKALEQKLDAQSPYRERLQWLRRQVAMQARLDALQQALPLTNAQLRDYYEKNVLLYRWAQARVILIRFNPAPDKPIEPGGKPVLGEAEARAKAEEALAKLKAGADFAEVAQQYSEHEMTAAQGGQFDMIRGDDQTPPEVRETVLNLKEGEISGILRRTNGFYIFKADHAGQQPFEVVRNSIDAKLRLDYARDWMEARLKKYPVRLKRGELLAALARDPDAKLEEQGEGVLLAEVGGHPVTVADCRAMMRGAPESVQTQAGSDPQRFLSQYFLMEEESARVDQEGLLEKSPHRERLQRGRNIILAEAARKAYAASLPLGEKQLQDAYQAERDQYRWVKVKLLRISIGVIPSPPGSESEYFLRSESDAQAKMFAIQLQLRDGADFAELIRKHSEDPTTAQAGGDFGPIFLSTPNVPEEVKKVIFALREGQYSEPVVLPIGVFLFRLEKTGTRPLEEVRDEVERRYRESRLQGWLEEIRNSIRIKVENKELFDRLAARS